MVAELLTARPKRSSVLDDYAEHVQQRWAAGSTDAVALTAEITALGYRGSVKAVRRYLQPLRNGQNAQTTTPRPPTPPTAREATGWLTRHPDSLNDNERAARDAVLARSRQRAAGGGRRAAGGGRRKTKRHAGTALVRDLRLERPAGFRARGAS